MNIKKISLHPATSKNSSQVSDSWFRKIFKSATLHFHLLSLSLSLSFFHFTASRISLLEAGNSKLRTLPPKVHSPLWLRRRAVSIANTWHGISIDLRVNERIRRRDSDIACFDGHEGTRVRSSNWFLGNSRAFVLLYSPRLDGELDGGDRD